MASAKACIQNKMLRIGISAVFFCSLLMGCVRPDDGPSPFLGLSPQETGTAPLPEGPVQGPAFFILSDQVFVYGPDAQEVDIPAIVKERGGFLAAYTEEVGAERLTGGEILEKVSQDYSLHPLMLMALVEYTGGWMTQTIDRAASIHPAHGETPLSENIFTQLSWAADTLNYGFYAHRVGGLSSFESIDGVPIDLLPEINSATAAMQYTLAQILGYQAWTLATGPLGLILEFRALADETVGEEAPMGALADVRQPPMELPFASGEEWFFTSGPHPAWGSGAAWGAIDLAPDEEGVGCYQSSAWVRAVADGVITRTGDGMVMHDLDGDGNEGTGWVVLYMHIAPEEMVLESSVVSAGDAIGHSSCAGGPATGTHLHIARKYNGEWIPADQQAPFDLSGWVSSGSGSMYDGFLTRGTIRVAADGFPTAINKVYH